MVWGAIFPSAPALAQEPERLYEQARKSYQQLLKNPDKSRFRGEALLLVEQFQMLYQNFPDTPLAEKAMFITGRVYLSLYEHSLKEKDLEQSLDHLVRLIKHYPQSHLADDAQYLIAEITLTHKNDPEKALVEFLKVDLHYPQGDMRPKAKEKLEALTKKQGVSSPRELPKPDLARVTRMRHWSNPTYTRIVLDVDTRVSFKPTLLKADDLLGKPQRLLVDLNQARLEPTFTGLPTIRDGLLKSARAAQHKPDTVRVVLDIQGIKDYKIFSLEDPHRVVIDVTGKETEPKAKTSREEKLSLARQLGLGVKTIILDPGHGGKDKGATGPGGVHEKDVVLKITRFLAESLRNDLGVQVILTREDDRFIPLEERTAFANTKKADLFISIHANASLNTRASGIETYYLNLTTDEDSIRLAARENATSARSIGELQGILNDLLKSSKIHESQRLAELVQNSLVEGLGRRYQGVKNLGVKKAPFYVLIGAEMPSILVETAFISNPLECSRLGREEFLEALAKGLTSGIQRYMKEIKVAGK